jgi:hypothetical protein
MFASVVSLFFYRRDERPIERAIIGAAMFTVLLWVLLTLTPHEQGPSLWQIVRFIPGGMAIRCVSRVYVVVYLFGSFAALTWLTQVTARINREWLRTLVQAIVIGAMMFEQTHYQQPSFERKNFYPLVDDTAKHLNGAEAGYVVPRYVDLTGETKDGTFGEVFAMWVSLRANVPVLNGYTGRAPKGFPLMETLTDDQIRDWLKGKFRGTVRIIDTEAPGQYRYVVVE